VAAYHDTILSSIVTVIQGLTLTGIASANIKRRMLPKASETLDKLPAVLVAPASGKGRRRPHTWGAVNRVYPIEVAIVTPVNRDFATKIADVTQWLQTIEAAFDGPRISGAATVWDVDVDVGATFDRSTLNQQYAYSSLLLNVHSHELWS
jgi:hypothetical protein